MHSSTPSPPPTRFDPPPAPRPRHSVRDVEFIKAVLTELKSARLQFPTNEHQLAALTEEVGELAQALIDCARGTQTPTDVYIEAVQVAAMACRVAVDGDQSFGYLPPPLKDDAALGLLPEEPPPRWPESLSNAAARMLTPNSYTPITGWIALMHDPDAPARTGVASDPPFYACPTVWPDRYAALKVYGDEKIAAFIPLNSHVGENK